MRQIHLISLVIFQMLWSFICPAQTTFPNNGPANPHPSLVAFIHANIQVNPDSRLTDAILVVRDGKIESVGKGIPIPPGARIIDLNGKYIYPSFIDLFSNYGITVTVEKDRQVNQYSGNRTGAYVWNDAVKTDIDAARHFQFDEKKSGFYLRSGFGATLSSNLDGIFRGSSALVVTANLPEQSLVINPLAASGLSFNKGSSRQDYPGSAMGCVALIRQTYYDANWYKSQNKEYSLSFENFNRIKNLPAVFEVENKFAALRAARIGKEFGITYIIKGKGDEYQRLKEIKACGSPLILPLNFPTAYDVEDPFDAQYINLADLKHWEMAPSNAAKVSGSAIPFAFTAFGLNNPDEFWKNIRKALQYGLTEKEALKALTTTPALLIHEENRIGQLKAGFAANFFITEKPVFEKDSRILEHWILGYQTAFEDLNPVLITGNYSLDFPGLENASLQISGSNFKPTAKIISADTISSTIEQNNGLYTLTFKEPGKSNRLIRAELWATTKEGNQATTLAGNAVMPNGNSMKLSAKLTSKNNAAEKADSSKEKDSGPVLFPFTEYGAETLPKAESVLFKNATVWTNESAGILTETDVLISNGKIIAVGKNLKSEGARVIDATGMHLTSGIIDEHSHIAIYRGVNECTQNNTAEVRIGDVINADDINIYRQLAGGVVACQQLHGSCNPIGGQSSLIKLRWGKAPEEMKIEGADGFIKFALGENVKQSNWNNDGSRFPQTRMGVEQVYFDAFIRAREYEKRKKENPSLTRIDLEMETLVEILNKKRFISCHSYVQSEINMLMHVADSMHFRINTFTHILEGYKVADKMKNHGVCASTFADWWAYKYEVAEAIPQNGAILQKMGVTTAINSDDAEMGRRLNQEAAKMIKYGGLTEEEAWKMVTLNPAIMLHLDKRTGSIKPDKDADLVLWTGNPLSIYSKPAMTFVDGICYFSLEKDEELRIANRKERERIIQKMILARKNGEKTEKRVSEQDPDYHCEDY